MSIRNFAKLFDPGTVAVIGASQRRDVARGSASPKSRARGPSLAPSRVGPPMRRGDPLAARHVARAGARLYRARLQLGGVHAGLQRRLGPNAQRRHRAHDTGLTLRDDQFRPGHDEQR